MNKTKEYFLSLKVGRYLILKERMEGLYGLLLLKSNLLTFLFKN